MSKVFELSNSNFNRPLIWFKSDNIFLQNHNMIIWFLDFYLGKFVVIYQKNSNFCAMRVTHTTHTTFPLHAIDQRGCFKTILKVPPNITKKKQLTTRKTEKLENQKNTKMENTKIFEIVNNCGQLWTNLEIWSLNLRKCLAEKPQENPFEKSKKWCTIIRWQVIRILIRILEICKVSRFIQT